MFILAPELNGVIKRFHRILNEQVLSINQFDSLAEAKKDQSIY